MPSPSLVQVQVRSWSPSRSRPQGSCGAVARVCTFVRERSQLLGHRASGVHLICLGWVGSMEFGGQSDSLPAYWEKTKAPPPVAERRKRLRRGARPQLGGLPWSATGNEPAVRVMAACAAVSNLACWHSAIRWLPSMGHVLAAESEERTCAAAARLRVRP